MEAVHGNPEKHSFVAFDNVEFAETTSCSIQPEEALPQEHTTTATTPVPPTEPPDCKTIHVNQWHFCHCFLLRCSCHQLWFWNW